MTLSEQLLATLVLYGLPVLGGVILLAAVGVPLPASLLLIAAGAFVEQGQLSYPWTVVVATTAAVVGDHLGYSLGRWGGPPTVVRISRFVGGPARVHQAEAAARRWGGLGIFVSRWLLAPLGPAINLTSGVVRYPWMWFFVYDVTGELVWVVVYTTFGRIFSDQVQALSAVLGNVTWALCGVVLVLSSGGYALRRARRARTTQVVEHERGSAKNA
jgi:membrane protein DedA with SNARE-associated domain